MKVDSGGEGGNRIVEVIEDGMTVSVLCELMFCDLLKGLLPAIGVMRELGEPEPEAGLAAIGDSTGLLLEVGGGGAGALFLLETALRKEGVPDETSFLGGACNDSFEGRS